MGNRSDTRKLAAQLAKQAKYERGELSKYSKKPPPFVPERKRPEPRPLVRQYPNGNRDDDWQCTGCGRWNRQYLHVCPNCD